MAAPMLLKRLCTKTLLNTRKMSSITNLKQIACSAIDSHHEKLNELSQDLWKHPELAFQEVYAHDRLTRFLEAFDFNIERKYKLDTAFKGTAFEENTGPNILVCCEYDALPGIGHACGHNLIAEVGVATAVGIQAALSAADKPLGRLTVLGTPGEEGGCGKADLIRLGAFEGVDVAMMAHPSPTTLSKPKFTSMTPVKIVYRGKASHAASFPWEGLNALDAAVLCYNNLSCLRQQMKPTWRVHGVIRNGGAQPNVIPEETELEYYLRTPSDTEQKILKEKVAGCIQAAAMATGCTVEFEFGAKSYSSLLSNNTMTKLYVENALAMGVVFETDPEKIQKFGGSTDMGNVSHVVPSIHPKFYIGTLVSNHTKGFAEASGAQTAQPYTLAVAKALAMTALDIYTNPDILEQIKKDFQQDLAIEAS